MSTTFCCFWKLDMIRFVYEGGDAILNERIKELRHELKMSQEDFGKKLGVTKSAISRIEKKVYNVTDSMVKLICREFNVNYIWLVDGTGDMFLDYESSILDSIDQIMFGESEFHKNLIKMTVDLSIEELEVIEKLLDKYIDLKKKKADD